MILANSFICTLMQLTINGSSHKHFILVTYMLVVLRPKFHYSDIEKKIRIFLIIRAMTIFNIIIVDIHIIIYYQFIFTFIYWPKNTTISLFIILLNCVQNYFLLLLHIIIIIIIVYFNYYSTIIYLSCVKSMLDNGVLRGGGVHGIQTTFPSSNKNFF